MGNVRERLLYLMSRKARASTPREPFVTAKGKKPGVHGGVGTVDAILMPTVARSMWAFAMLGQYDEELYCALAVHGKVRERQPTCCSCFSALS